MRHKKKLDQANKVYESLIVNLNSRIAKSLAIIKEACDKEAEKIKPEFTIAHISRLSSEQGGPKEQSIRNKTASGQVYHRLIKAYADIFKDRLQDNGKITSTSIEAKIDCLEDVQLKWALYDLVGDNKKLKNQLHSCQEALKVPVSYTSDGQVLDSAPKHLLNAEDIQILKHYISEDNLKHHGWSISEYGQIVGLNGVAISKIGFKDAIDKVIAASSEFVPIENE